MEAGEKPNARYIQRPREAEDKWARALANILGCQPTAGEFAASIAQREATTGIGRKAVIESIADRMALENTSALRTGRYYYPVATRQTPVNMQNIIGQGKYFDALIAGAPNIARVTEPNQTHYFSPGGMRAYERTSPNKVRNPEGGLIGSKVRSSVWRKIEGVPTPIPSWALEAVAPQKRHQ